MLLCYQVASCAWPFWLSALFPHFLPDFILINEGQAAVCTEGCQASLPGRKGICVVPPFPGELPGGEQCCQGCLTWELYGGGNDYMPLRFLLSFWRPCPKLHEGLGGLDTEQWECCSRLGKLKARNKNKHPVGWARKGRMESLEPCRARGGRSRGFPQKRWESQSGWRLKRMLGGVRFYSHFFLNLWIHQMFVHKNASGCFFRVILGLTVCGRLLVYAPYCIMFE